LSFSRNRTLLKADIESMRSPVARSVTALTVSPAQRIFIVDTQEATMVANVQKWGNSLAVRIPRPFATDVGIEEGTSVDVTIENGGIVIRKARGEKLSLDALLAGVTAKNRHAETDTGPAVGNEAW
jgi:antitoxin MazE